MVEQLRLRLVRDRFTGLPEVGEIIEIAYRPREWYQARVLEVSDAHLVAEFIGPRTPDRISDTFRQTGYDGSVKDGHGDWWRRPA